MKIMLLSGSFRKHSYSLALLRAVAELLEEHRCELPDLDQLPLYNEDRSGDHRPEVVRQFQQQVEDCDAIVVCSPEYNHSIPAVLKNAIDWASRPAFHSPLKDKPVTIITQASSLVGGARAQAHLKLVFDATLSRIHPSHEMMIPDVKAKFDEHWQLVDDHTIKRLDSHLEDFMGFVDGLAKSQPVS
ncbi:MAG: NADPH-dependent FMN reductase [Porticoccaceae bacterium]